MIQKKAILIWSLLFVYLSVHIPVQAADIKEEFIKQCHTIAGTLTGTENVYEGKNNWLFFKAELEHAGAGMFWGENSSKVSKANKKQYADPLPAILHFNEECKKNNILLIFVPVPAKAFIYPEMIGDLVKPDKSKIPRLDKYHEDFIKLLKEKGVTVVDLVPSFLKQRFPDHGKPLYCKSDTHWAGPGIETAAELIASYVKNTPWYNSIPGHTFSKEQISLRIEGDLMRKMEKTGQEKEELTLTIIKEKTGASSDYIPSWEKSPVLLIGDSHTLVFHTGDDLYSKGGGLADLLSYELGFPVDLMGVRGSGSNATRVNLYRKAQKDPSYLASKKVVIWCLSVREFTESTQGWKEVPLLK